MNNSPTNSALNVNSCVMTAYQYAWANRHEFAKLALVPVVLLSLILLVLNNFFPGPLLSIDVEKQTFDINERAPFELLVQGIFYVMFAVAWHRKWLVPDEDVTVAEALKWDGRKTRFFLRSVLVFVFSLLSAVPVLVLVGLLESAGLALGPIGVFVMIVVSLMTLARFSLWLPACAADDPVDLVRVWFATKGNSWRMMGIWMLPQLPVMIVHAFAGVLLGSFLLGLGLEESQTGIFILMLVTQAIYYFGVAVAVSALSIAYLHFKAQVPEMTAED